MSKEELNNNTIETSESDYQGPTAKEIVVNSIKIDKTNKNLFGLVVLIIVLVFIGFVAISNVFNDKDNKEVDYLEGVPKWVETFHDYFSSEYDELVSYNVVFLDLDFDNKVEALVNYLDGNKTLYDIIDTEDSIYVKGIEISDVFLTYTFNTNEVLWFANTSFNSMDMNLIDLGKRLNGSESYETYLNSDNLSKFKSEHVTLSYELRYSKVNFRTTSKNVAEAFNIYLEEKDKVDNIINNVLNKYSNGV